MSIIGNSPKYSNYTSEYFSGDNTTTSFTLSQSVGSAASVLVLIDGVKQFANTYNINSTSLVFTEAPPTGTGNIEVIPLGLRGQVNTVAASAIGTSELAANAVTTAKIADSNITFAKLDSTAQTQILQGDTSVIVSDTGSNGKSEISIDGVVAERRNSSGIFSYIRSDTGGNSNTLYSEYQCRAWVNFDGTGTVAIRGAGNVSSITDNGTGSYTINLATAMPDTNYGVNIAHGTSGAVGRYAGYNNTSTSAIAVKFQDGSATLQDNPNNTVSIFR
jgi:hypothetical protein